MVVVVNGFSDSKCQFPYAPGERLVPFARGWTGDRRLRFFFSDGTWLPGDAVAVVDDRLSSVWIAEAVPGPRPGRCIANVEGPPGLGRDIDAFLVRDSAVLAKYASIAELIEHEWVQPRPAAQLDGEWCFCSRCGDAWNDTGAWIQCCPACAASHTVGAWERAARRAVGALRA